MISVTGKTQLKDIHFAIMYHVYNKSLSMAQASSEATKHIDIVYNDSSVNFDKKDPSLILFYRMFVAPILNGTVLAQARPLIKILENEVAKIDRRSVFLNTVQISGPNDPWHYDLIPNYFMENPIKGVQTLLINSFSDTDLDADNCSLVLSSDQFTQNCLQGGYIKSNIEVRLITPRYDTKIKNQVIDIFDSLLLKTDNFKKVLLKNELQVWSFTITPTTVDFTNLTNSNKQIPIFSKIVEEFSDGKNYFVYLEDEKISTKGFKTLDSVQKFITRIVDNCSAMTHSNKQLYLKNTLHLLSIRKSQDALITLDRFNFGKSRLHQASAA